MKLQTWSRALVAALSADGTKPEDLASLKSRALSLPAMLRKNGLLQTTLFLKAKGGTDETLRTWLGAGLDALDLPGDGAYWEPETLAHVPLMTYLLYTEAALETSVWMKRLVEADGVASAGASDDGEAA